MHTFVIKNILQFFQTKEEEKNFFPPYFCLKIYPHDNIKIQKNKHLSLQTRSQLELMITQGIPKTQIAQQLNISRRTIYNELHNLSSG